MARTEKLSVTLTEEQIAALESAVAAGEYATTSDILREAVDDWQRKRADSRTDAERLGRLWDAGIASGSAGPVDFQAVRREAQARLATARKARGDAD